MPILDPSFMSLLSVQPWHKTLSQTDGRDKLLRLLQYLCKLLRGLDSGRTIPKGDSAVSKVFAVETALATSRQIWRLFKWASVYAKSRGLSLSTVPDLPDLARIINDAAMFSYYLCDNITFLCKVGILKTDVKMASRRAARFWLTAIVAGLVGSAYNVADLHRREVRLVRAIEADKDDEEKRMEYAAVLRQKRAALAGCVKHSVDCVVAGSLSTANVTVHPSMVGGCGVVSSLIGMWQTWPRYMPEE